MRSDTNDLWRVVYMAHSPQALAAAERLLTGEGFLVRRGELNRSISGADAGELRVLESEAREARQLLTENGF